MRFIIERTIDKKRELVSVIAESIEAAQAHYKNCRIFKLTDKLSFEQAKEKFLKQVKSPAKLKT